MTDYVKIAATFFLISVLVFLGKVFIGHLLSKSREKQGRLQKLFNEAAKKFRESFTDEIISLESDVNYPPEIVHNILKDAFTKHKEAMIDFKSVLRGGKSRRFERAWQEYCYPIRGKADENEGYELLFLDYVPGQKPFPKNVSEAKKLALGKISRLLSFAESK